MVLHEADLVLARQAVWELLIEKHGLSYDDARRVCNQVGNELRERLEASS